MSQVYMRNKTSGEIRDVESDSSEFRDLQKEVTSLGQPMWEQTNIAHAEAIKERASTGNLFEEDLGSDDQDALRFEALKLAAEGVAPEANPHLFLTPGEIEAGLTPAQKQADLAAMYSERTGRSADIFSEAAGRIHGGESESQDAPELAGQHSAMAGGSDDREDAPMRGAFASSGGGDGESKQTPPVAAAT